MKAVILAAGQGTRLRPLTDALPKCLLTVGGQTLLERSLDNLKARAVEQVVIVVGFCGDQIRRQIGPAYRGMHITYVDNDAYARTGSMSSLSCAREVLQDEILLLESDLLYDGWALDRLLEAGHSDAILIAALTGSGDDVFVCADDKCRVTCLGKVLPQTYTGRLAGCLVGISRLSRKFLDGLFAQAEQDYGQGALLYHYEECVLAASRSHTPVYAVFADNLAWTEIDTPGDLQRAKTEVYPRLTRNGA